MEQLFELLSELIGQPVVLVTDEGMTFRGTVMNVFPNSVRIITREGNIYLILYRKVISLHEPTMCLHCNRSDFEDFELNAGRCLCHRRRCGDRCDFEVGIPFPECGGCERHEHHRHEGECHERECHDRDRDCRRNDRCECERDCD